MQNIAIVEIDHKLIDYSIANYDNNGSSNIVLL